MLLLLRQLKIYIMGNNIVLLRCIQLTKIFSKYTNVLVKVLDNINFTIQYNEIVAITGASGSGKSTFLHLLGGLDQPTSGEIFFENNVLNKLSDRKFAMIRNRRLGFVYQFHHLLSDFNVLENVAMPLLISGFNLHQSKIRAEYMLKLVGLQDRIRHYPNELSGGESQRVAIARAVINYPALVLADEPTGNLDQKNSNDIFKLLKKINMCYGTALLIATHDLNLARKCHKVFNISYGQLKAITQCVISDN